MSAWDILRQNALQVLMYILGAALCVLLWWPLAVIYLVYAVLSNVLYMAWVCPYCGHYSLGTCPAGLDILSVGASTRARVHVCRISPKCGRNDPRLVLPPIVGLYLLVMGFSWLMLSLLVVFCLVAFWWLPESSKKHCEGCETVDCPRGPKPKLIQL